MENFAAIDFETANEQRTSVCSVGVVIVRNGEIADSYYSLIRPEPEYYTLNPQLHSRSATYKRNGLLIRKTAIKSSRPFQCAYYPLTP